MQLVKTEQLLAQPYVAVHLIHVGMYRIYQIVIDLGRNIVAEYSCFKAVCVFTRLGLEDMSLYLTRIESGKSILIALICAVHSVEGLLAHSSVPALEERDVASVGKSDLLAVFIGYFRKYQIRIVEH